MGATAKYIKTLTQLKPGSLGLLRSYSGLELDESVDGFDLFAGLWWPLRRKSPKTPRRKVAWLIAKLYAFCPLENSPGDTLPCQLRRCEPNEEKKRKRFSQKFDELLLSSLDSIEPALQWALREIASKGFRLDWIKLTDDLSIWEKESKRLEWTNNYLYKSER
ncbi:MAG: type I-E CRISPR-associated protein Cse2/CasB [FCB group bacterium]|nr:type I-E CRISPR-associated protein Cse2/CasB [FCB group bacterium]